MGYRVCATCKKCWSDCQADLWCPECHPRCERWGSAILLPVAAVHALVFFWGLWTGTWWASIGVAVSWSALGLAFQLFNRRMRWNLPRSEWPQLHPPSAPG